MAYVEAHYEDDAQKNALCQPVPLAGGLGDYVHTQQLNLANQFAWSRDKALRNWIRTIRLDAFQPTGGSGCSTDTDKIALLGQLR